MNAPLAGRRTAEILLAEDNEDDVFLMREAFKRSPLPVNLHTVENGVECLAFLRKEGRHAGMPTPDLLLLDLNMPVMDGRQLLATMVADPRLKTLPVVVLTTSENKRDVRQMYELRCSTYIVKPLDFEDFEKLIELICQYWFATATLPRNEP